MDFPWRRNFEISLFFKATWQKAVDTSSGKQLSASSFGMGKKQTVSLAESYCLSILEESTLKMKRKAKYHISHTSPAWVRAFSEASDRNLTKVDWATPEHSSYLSPWPFWSSVLGRPGFSLWEAKGCQQLPLGGQRSLSWLLVFKTQERLWSAPGTSNPPSWW